MLVKYRKAVDADNMFPEFIKNTGSSTRQCLVNFTKTSITLRKSKILAIAKPGKNAALPESYKPIVFLSVCYKLLKIGDPYHGEIVL